MPMPSKLHFIHDGNTAEIIDGTLDESGGDSSAMYVYTKSETKKGMQFEIEESRVNRLLGFSISIPKNAKWVSKKSEQSSPVAKVSETAGKTTTELLEMMKHTKKKSGSARGAKK